MNKQKAILCTVLYAIVLIAVFTFAIFVKNEEYGISLYQVFMYAIANAWLGNSIIKFYEWLKK
jgi:hypothetical protein